MDLKFDIHTKEHGTGLGKNDCWSFQIKSYEHYPEVMVNMDVLFFYSSNTYFHHLKLQNVILSFISMEIHVSHYTRNLIAHSKKFNPPVKCVHQPNVVVC